jgi:hypothetical protein
MTATPIRMARAGMTRCEVAADEAADEPAREHDQRGVPVHEAREHQRHHGRGGNRDRHEVLRGVRLLDGEAACAVRTAISMKPIPAPK